MTPADQRPARDEMIDRILAGTGGIFGTEVCQICGKLGTYRGLCGAMASHGGTALAEEFIPPWHGHRRGHVPKKQTLRYCEVCLQRVAGVAVAL
jgi:hypothetical protein